MQSLNEAFKSYLLYIRHERGLSQRTCAVYTAWVHHFERWLDDNGHQNAPLETFSTPVLKRYLYAMSEQGLRPRTIHSAFNPLRGLGVYLVANEILPVNPAKKITLPKKDAALRTVTSDDEITQLLEACDRQADGRKALLARGLIATLVYSGLRREELLSLKVSDVDLEQRAILVRSGKGAKSRVVYPCSECIVAVKEWLAVRGHANHDWLWALDCHRRVHHNGLKAILDQVRAIAGLKTAKHIQPHSLRHAFATRLLRNGANLRDIQSALGHSSLQVTMVYLHSDEQSQRKIAELGSLKKPEPERERQAERPAERFKRQSFRRSAR